MYSDAAALYNISSLLVNCTNHQMLPGRKWKKKIVSFVFSVLYQHEATN